MIETFEILFTQEWAIRALISSSIVGLMCGALGCFIVLRNMAMIGDAMSHAILPGVVVAYVIKGSNTIAFFLGSVVAGLLTALGITWIQRNVNTKNDAAIGIVFTAMFAIGVIGISHISKSQGVHLDLKDFLFGNVLGVSNEDLILTGCIGIYVILSIIVFYRYLFTTTFQPVIAETMGISVSLIHYFLMLMLSFAVVASLRAVGVILVVAMLITPASTALLLSNKLKHVVILASIIGLLSAVIGLIISIEFNTTPGPAMTVVSTIFYFVAVIFAPQRGLLFKNIRNNKLRKKIMFEDTLKQAFRLSDQGELNVKSLQEKLGYSNSMLKQNINVLIRKGLASNQPSLVLTKAGISQASKLVRAHRLWETYLVNQMGLSSEQIHEDAEKYEHLLTEEILDEVDAKLGFPDFDPHGSPIPKKDK